MKGEKDYTDKELQLMLDSLDDVLAEKADKHLRYFLPYYWNCFEGTPFRGNWHIDNVAEHVEHALAGEIKRLMICVPPRSSKSSIVSVAAPAFKWSTAPETKFLCASHSLKLVTQNFMLSRRLMEHEKYAKRYSNSLSPQYSFQLSGDQNTKMKIENNANGRLDGTTPGSNTLGQGFKVGILDDLLDTRNIHSNEIIEEINAWIADVFMQRSDDKDDDTIILIMQRLKENDPVAYLQANFASQGWFTLNIPASYDAERTYISPLGSKWNDPRKVKGELIDKTGRICTAASLAAMNPVTRMALYEQNPGGGTKGYVVGQQCIRYIQTRPKNFDALIIVWDLTFSASLASKSWNMGLVVGKSEGNYYIIDFIRGKMEIKQQEEALEKMAKKYPKAAIGVEEKANGAAVMSNLKVRYPNIIAFKTAEWGGTKQANKSERFGAVNTLWTDGLVYIYKPIVPDTFLEPTYDTDLIVSEITGFPLAGTTEVVDTSSYALGWLRAAQTLSKIHIFGENDPKFTDTEEDWEDPRHIAARLQAGEFQLVFTDTTVSMDDIMSINF